MLFFDMAVKLLASCSVFFMLHSFCHQIFSFLLFDDPGVYIYIYIYLGFSLIISLVLASYTNGAYVISHIRCVTYHVCDCICLVGPCAVLMS
jgi:hypothetical protein